MNLSLGFPEFSQELAVPETLAGSRGLAFPVGAPGAGLGRPRHSPPAGGGGGLRGDSGGGGRAAARGAREARHRAALHTPGGCLRRDRAGPQRGHRDAHRQRQDAVLQPAGAEPAAGRPRARGPCTCFPPRRWPRTSFTNFRRGGRDGLGDPRLHLRRRHAAGRAQGRPAAGQRGADQSRTCCTPAFCRTTRAGRGISRACATS
jgi:hypothetical protein